ncbi:di-trans,poly-cis-decaprenylcistransferase [Streptomyces piniterrae]|uniref:Isoprenyl transferase n=1 Tax=Streptomyces piniterrae TaxID=2571125 RepID=A0A4U0NIP1_9ACTN|nr:polyprenyl diphosphate synthase [Streptomyces piniterrae]TJZ54145.1 di-trans,poly-cis-decaprenylcistransferase [Streptomyces piniterrae]
MLGNETADAATPELYRSYELCERVAQRLLGPFWSPSQALPSEVRPRISSVVGFALWTDRLADEGGRAHRERRLAQWCADTLGEVRAGRSEHPLRRAFVHTMRQWDLDVALLEQFLEATQADSAAPPAFATFADQRRHLWGVGGSMGEMWTPLLEPCNAEAALLMSVLAEAGTVADILQDFPIDLARGRCYLPGDDLQRLGLEVGDLALGEPRDALDELIGLQVARARDLLEQAVPVAGMVQAACQPFVHAMILGVECSLEEAGRLRSRVLREGISPETLTVSRPWPERSDHRPGPAPAHVAVIMDGNRRWAAQRGLSPTEGHSAGGRAAVRLLHSALRLGIRHLSVFAFSTENWNRPREEVDRLFDVMAEGITKAAEWMHRSGVRVRWCGQRDQLDQSVASALVLVESLTSNNTALTLNVFVDYGGRDEMVAAARALAAEAVAGTIRPEDIGPEDVVRNLCAPDLPEVDLLIRTSGEQRISNFLPWHLAYAELVFEPAHWPDFSYQHLLAAVMEYSGRQRRFGADAGDHAGSVEMTEADSEAE